MSEEEGCHFCTLIWQTMDDREGFPDLVLSAHRMRDISPRLSESKVNDVSTLTSRNIDYFQNDIPLESLPHTLREAIKITGALGCRYSWMDFFCIMKDSKADWPKESAVMGDINQNSLCTIIAAVLDNADRGYFSARNPLSCDWCRLAGEGKDAIYASLVYRSSGARYEFLIEHAWVLQERLISPRILHFGPGVIYRTYFLGSASERNVERTGAPSTESPSQNTATVRSLGREDRVESKHTASIWPPRL